MHSHHNIIIYLHPLVCSGYRLPRFRDGHILRALAIALGSAFYIVRLQPSNTRQVSLIQNIQPLLLVSHPIHFLVLPIVAIVFELALSYAVAVGFRFFGAVHQAFFKALSLINPFGTIWKRIEDSSESADKCAWHPACGLAGVEALTCTTWQAWNAHARSEFRTHHRTERVICGSCSWGDGHQVSFLASV